VSAADFLRRIVAALDAAAIPYMVTGSFASTAHGGARATMDHDLVVVPTPEALDHFLASLSPDDYYVDPDVARSALRARGMFNVIDMATSWKADLVVRKARAFSQEELRRRIAGSVLGVACMLTTPEDSILSKLEWAKAASSERQLDDVAGIVATQGDSLDIAYIERWSVDLDVADLWARVRGR
jgi:hypothetical protein